MDKLLQELIEYIGNEYTKEQDFFLRMLLDDAVDEVCEKLYPYGFENDSEAEKAKEYAIKRYGSKIRRIAQFHYDKQGKEGVTGYSESGTSVSYDGAGTPLSYFRGIIPVARIVQLTERNKNPPVLLQGCFVRWWGEAYVDREIRGANLWDVNQIA